MAAAVWIGGGAFYALILHPALARVGRTPERSVLLAAAGREFGEVVRLAIVVFVATGVVLAYTRLTQPRLSTGYVLILALKVVLSLVMFWLARRIGRGKPARAVGDAQSPSARWWRQPQYQILFLGAVVYLLSLALRIVYEQSLGVPI